MSKNTDNCTEYSKSRSEYYVYILRCSDDTFYTGITNDLKRRLNMHNSGIASKYTKPRLPVCYVYIEAVTDKSHALKRELAIKKMTRAAKIDLINDTALNMISTALTAKQLFL